MAADDSFGRRLSAPGDADIRILAPGDEAALETFLLPRAASSMFLRSNVAAAGLVDRGEVLHASYAAAFAGGAIVSVAAHAWNGILLVQAPDDALLPRLVKAAVTASGRAVTGFAGPRAQVVAARTALALNEARATLDSCEDLFTLALADLRVPEPLAAGTWQCRAPRADERELLAGWRADYHEEALGVHDAGKLDDVRRGFTVDGVQRVLVVDGALVAFATLNAALPDVVQVGGVFTPAPLRGSGYARGVVAGLLADARARGATGGILFTDGENVAARTAYLALGFRIVGDYGLVLLA